MTTELMGTVYGFEINKRWGRTVAVRCGHKVVRFPTDDTYEEGEAVRVMVEKLPEQVLPGRLATPEEFLDG